MWVWYCRPPIGAHFHPTPQPPTRSPAIGEKAHLRTVAAVLANATATTLVYPSVHGPAPARRPCGPAGLRAGGPARPAGPRARRPRGPIAAAVYVSPELYSLPVYQEFASLRPPLGGRTRLVLVNEMNGDVIQSRHKTTHSQTYTDLLVALYTAAAITSISVMSETLRRFRHITATSAAATLQTFHTLTQGVAKKLKCSISSVNSLTLPYPPFGRCVTTKH